VRTYFRGGREAVGALEIQNRERTTTRKTLGMRNVVVALYAEATTKIINMQIFFEKNKNCRRKDYFFLSLH